MRVQLMHGHVAEKLIDHETELPWEHDTVIRNRYSCPRALPLTITKHIQ